jgi:hypothetical protein
VSSRTIDGLRFGAGVEGTFEPKSGRDTLKITRHFSEERYREDFRLAAELGLRELRYPMPWHVVERTRGHYDWTTLDAILQAADQYPEISIIADPMHHTSFPRWLEGGFLNSEFPDAYVRFVSELTRRYSFETLTPFNEPTCTLDFCGYRGFWYPYTSGDRSYVTVVRHAARATAGAIHAFRQIRATGSVLHVDTFQRHAALDTESEKLAHHLNERRFLFEELLIGRVDRHHPLYRYLIENGFPLSDLEWHHRNPVVIDERGGNYYPLNEEELLNGRTAFAPSRHPVGLAGVVKEYADRLPYPLGLTETNIQGTPYDRISWLKYVLSEVEKSNAAGLRLHRFSWYPLFDCAGWNSLLQGARWKRDPQGIYSCDRSWNRCATPFTEIYRSVVSGMRAAEIPAYRFTARHAATLGPLQQQIKWDWIPQPRRVAEPRRRLMRSMEKVA